ncbi:MAG: protein translocase subunit SecD [Candidatus Gracilibacteria bacterium]|nr:protein translocase subunit SecD [Candidatus Gracilibacteria bacterium]
MKNLIIKLFLLTLAGAMLFVYVFPWSAYNIEVPFSGKDYKLGLDLQGGIELDYKIDLEEVKEEADYNKQKEKSIIEGLKSIIDKRVETLNINDSVITSASYGGEQHIIVQIPLKGNNTLENSENIKRAKEAIGRVVKIVFKERRKEITEDDLAMREKISTDLLNELQTSQYGFFVSANKYKDNYEKVEVGTVDSLAELNITDTNLLENEGLVGDKVEGTNEVGEEGKYVLEITKENSETKINYVFVADEPSEWIEAKDSEGRILNDKYFVKSSVQFDQAFKPMVELTFNDEGGKIFGELTLRLVGQQIAIFVGGEMLTAPNVNEPILSGKAVITGNYTAEEAKKLSTDINTGVVPAPIYLTSEKSIDSRLGLNSLEKLIVAGILGFVLIFVFLVYVYRLSGLMSAIALFLYTIIVLAVVKLFGVTLTLASIAGLILSIGMAIDANILIFERVREELNNGKKLDEACRIGFKKSWSAIWDSNVTGLIVAIILFVFGINLIKGFGLMLAIGIVVSLFSVMWISRVLIMLLAKSMKDRNSFIGK